jgi:predicted membrane GTPase involved in stress response
MAKNANRLKWSPLKEEIHQGAIMEKLGERKGDLTNMIPDGKGRILET